MVSAADLHALARFMVETHGSKALGLAERAVGELERINEHESAEHWYALRAVLADMLAGYHAGETISVH